MKLYLMFYAQKCWMHCGLWGLVSSAYETTTTKECGQSYRAGMPLVLLSEFLGHADVNTTRIYAWADTEMKRQAIQKVSKATAEDSIEPIWANDEEMIKRLYGLA